MMEKLDELKAKQAANEATLSAYVAAWKGRDGTYKQLSTEHA